MSTIRHKFTPEYRREAARLVIDTGRPVAPVARELGLGEQLSKSLLVPFVESPLGALDRKSDSIIRSKARVDVGVRPATNHLEFNRRLLLLEVHR